MKIKDFAQIINGATPSTKNKEYFCGNIVWVTPKDLSINKSKYIRDSEKRITEDAYNSCSTEMIPCDSILLSSRAPIGLLAINKVKCCTNQGFKSLILDKTKANVEYIYYYLKCNIKKIELLGGGTTFKEISKTILENLEIDLPNYKLQYKIAKILSSIDNKIELNNKVNDELEAMAKTIYDYWFLQFEFPNEEGKPYKSSGGKMVWNKELKREIPEGWINGHLKEYIKNQKAGDWGKENAIDNYQKEVTCIRGADFSSITSFEKMDMPRRFILEKNSFKLLSVYDLLIEISGGSPIQSTGRICYINDAVLKRFSTKLITSNFCKAISLTDNNYFYWFYMLWKTLYINNVFFNYESKTTGIKNLLFDIMCEKYPICKPPIQIIRLYNQQVTPYFNKIQQNIIENQELTSLRDFLLPLLMNGQVGFKGDKAEG